MADTLLIKKHLVKPFLNKGTSSSPNWVQIKKTTDFTRAMNPVTEERDYISDEHPTTEITDYKPSIPVTLTTYKGEDDFDYLYSFYKKRAIGADAQTEFLLVSIFDSVTKTVGDVDTTYYYAEKTNCTLAVDEWNLSGKTLSATIYENGTPDIGYVTIEDGVPTFTKGEMPTA